jgi:hypothetical protein
MTERRRLPDKSASVSQAIVFPRRDRGRLSVEAQSKYERVVRRFCERILEINSTLDFKVSSRGWCYILEEHGLLKGDFDFAQRLINDCRKSGELPLNICADDESRAFENIEYIDADDPEDYARNIVDELEEKHLYYTPISAWEDQRHYVEMLVEKVDLKSLFSVVCQEFYVPIANAGGWSDLNLRAEIMERFKSWEERGKKCVLLYCGDFDPGGFAISKTLRSNLKDLAQAVQWSPDDLTIDRFGLNLDFIEEQGLTWIENLATAAGKYPLDDPRHRDHSKPYVQDYLRRFGVRKVEANALVVRPEAGRNLCRQAILKYVSRPILRAYQRRLGVIQDEVRDHLVRLLSAGAS